MAVENKYQIPITYIVSASTVTPGQGLEPLKLSTILVLTDEQPITEQSQSFMIARTASAVVQAYGTNSKVAQVAQTIFSQQPNILANNGYVIIAPFNNDEDVNETYSAGITRLASEIYFEGVLTTRTVETAEAVTASNTVQAMKNRILFLPASTTDALGSNGLFTQVASNYNTKCLLYTLGINAETAQNNALQFAAAYASRGLAVNYNGSNTTLTMNLKDLVGIQADTNISETVLNQCGALGVDCFPSIEGLAKVMSFAQGGYYFDQIANRIWFVNAIQTAVFNALATTSTKIPQTESGISILLKAIRNVCNQAVANGMIASGTWNSPDTFGNYEDFYRNIEEFGYYIYAQPIAQQSQEERNGRRAPLIQVAAKEAGAIHSGNILVYLEA